MPTSTMSKPGQTPFFSPRRTLVLAANTFTHLIRMKVIYFLLVFLVLALAVNFLRLPHTLGPESAGAEELRMLKAPMAGAMKMFSVLLAIAATALLIPRDLEDRTLYTILAKPVPRLDYLLGKLLGVLLLIAIGLFIMGGIMNIVLHFRTQMVLGELMSYAQQQGWSQETIDYESAEVLRHGPSWSLQAGLATIFMESAIMAAIALLVSTFSSSTLFTIVLSSLVYFIGNLVAEGRDFWLEQSAIADSFAVRIASQVISVIFPDLRLYGVLDASISGQIIPLALMGKLCAISAIYVGIYTVLAWFVFSDKEI